MADENGLLGNLPRSRPGTRSQKREAKPAPQAAREPASRTSRPAPKDAKAAAAATRSGTKSRPRPTQQPPTDGPASPSDPVGEAVRTAAKVAGAGLKLADGMTRELLRRLPRP